MRTGQNLIFQLSNSSGIWQRVQPAIAITLIFASITLVWLLYKALVLHRRIERHVLVALGGADKSEITIALPYALLANLPVLSFNRASARINTTLMLALAILFAHGLCILWDWMETWPPSTTHLLSTASILLLSGSSTMSLPIARPFNFRPTFPPGDMTFWQECTLFRISSGSLSPATVLTSRMA